MRSFRKIGECTTDKIEDKSSVKVYAPKEVFIRLKEIAIDERTSVSEIIRTLIDNYLASRQNEEVAETA